MRFWEGRFGAAGENALWSFEHRSPAGQPPPICAVSWSRSTPVASEVPAIAATMSASLSSVSVSMVIATSSKMPVAKRRRRSGIEPSSTAPTATTRIASSQKPTTAARWSKPSSKPPAPRLDCGRAAKMSPHLAARPSGLSPSQPLYEQGRVHHVGHFPALEDQLLAFTSAGYMGDGSPDRADGLTWACTELASSMHQA
jgi:hypothetical protein